jgi:DNA-binding NarL/FixJ family response regulator
MLADDHRMMRQGVRRILEEKPGLKIIGEAGDGFELLALMKKDVPDMVIMDVSMPNLRGIEATREVKSQYPKVKVLILSMYKDKDYLAQAIAAGADGYILKEDADIELYSALEAIRNGANYVSPTLTDQVTDSFIKVLRKNPKQPFTEGKELTTRESEVLKLIAEGKTSRQIADLLSISVRTAENHRLNLMRKLGFKKNIQLVRYAITKGYVSETG